MIVTFYATPTYEGRKVGEPIRINVDTEDAGDYESALKDAAIDYACVGYGGLFRFEIAEVSKQE